MIVEVVGDLWTYPADWRCITTNGVVDSRGRLVMGGGCAKEARDRYPDLPYFLGHMVKQFGNHLTVVQDPKIIAFPTKHHWKDPSSLELIIQSATELMGGLDRLANWRGVPPKLVLLPRPGCGLGGLDWENDVKPAIEDILDERVAVISPGV